MISAPRFSLPCTERQALDILTAAYTAEVENRGGVYEATDDITRALADLAAFLTAKPDEERSKPRRKFGVMLAGLYGNGKTTTLRALQTAINLLNAEDLFEEFTGMPIVSARGIALLADEDHKAYTATCQRPLLAVDDMGREPAEVLKYGNTMNPVADLIEFRYNARLFTVITTNLTAPQIAEKYGQRIADRFNEMLHVIVYKGKTHRKDNV